MYINRIIVYEIIRILETVTLVIEFIFVLFLNDLDLRDTHCPTNGKIVQGSLDTMHIRLIGNKTRDSMKSKRGIFDFFFLPLQLGGNVILFIKYHPGLRIPLIISLPLSLLFQINFELFLQSQFCRHGLHYTTEV